MPSPATLAILTTDFKSTAIKHKGTPDLMSQYNWPPTIKWDVYGGSCNGLSIMWLKFKRKPLLGTSLFLEIRSSHVSEATKKALIEETEEAHRAQKGLGDTEASGALKTRAKMLHYGMTFREQKLYGGGWGKGHTEMGRYIGSNAGYYLIDVPGHAMAACSIGQPTFYDPNVGEVTFPTGVAMGKFFSDFFKTTKMQSNYSPNKAGGKVQVTINRYT